MRLLYLTFFLVISGFYTAFAQNNLVTYAGNSGKETFYDVTQITDGTFIVCGYADNLNWIPVTVPKIQLSYTGNIPNGQGTNKYGFLLHLSKDLKTILNVVHFAQGAVEDIRFIKTNSLPYKPTGDLFISCNTADIDNNNGGYIIAKLNNNFVNGIPNSLTWYNAVWAKSGPKDYHPWDVTSSGKVYYISGESHAYDWSAVYCLDENGKRTVVENWRTHWLNNGSEWKGTPASSNPQGGIDSVKYSGIALKIWGRCELRSWNQSDFNTVLSDGNGGTKKGKWPADFLFNSPCDPANPTANSPGYNGYSPEACCPVWGGSSICVDRRTNEMYLGMNFKSYYNPLSSPDFEPAVIAFDSTGNLRWWSRLYHEITPNGDTVGSVPDQYVDAMAIDYMNNKLVVAARSHGNNTENLWEGNTISADANAYGFQNRFTGTNGNIHESWLGKLLLSNGTLTNSTYVAELAEGTTNLGTAHSDPNLDGWPDPNTGWPDVNTTRITKNNMKISSSGDVCILAVGRRTITTANAYQKMVKPFYGGKSCWNSFARVYDSEFHVPKYSSLIVGKWDTVTQAGGDNTEMFGIYKTNKGIICVGRHKADSTGNAIGNFLPTINVTPWGNSNPQNESAVLVYYEAANLLNPNDSIPIATAMENYNSDIIPDLFIYPNPANGYVTIEFTNPNYNNQSYHYILNDIYGKILQQGKSKSKMISLNAIPNGIYFLRISVADKKYIRKITIVN